MSSRVKFISTTFLKEHSTISRNVDDDTLIPYIWRAQDINLQQILGTTFYDRLIDGVVNNNLNSDEDSLLRNYIQQMIVEWTIYYVLPSINMKMTNKSVTQDSSEFGTPSSLDDVKYLRQNVRDMAEFYSKRLTTYLCDFGNTLFPEYANPSSNENVEASGRAYFNGVFIPNRTPRDYGLRVVNDPSNDCPNC
jgi:superfamily I DNA/RNA helicase